MNKYELRNPIPHDIRNELVEYSDILANILYNRGIRTKEEARIFLNPDYDNHTHDPFLLKDMEKAVSRIIKAVKGGQRICVYSDYDADGIPGAVILTNFFNKIKYNNYFVYIPHRNIEGFGLNTNAIRKIKEDKTELIITIDCGISDINETDLINSLGMDVIITDHHEPNGEIPNAYAIVDHRQEDCSYPEKILCGSGVIFKVVQGIIHKGDFNIEKGWEKWLLDMVGIATLSDMVPLHGENRVFAHYGLMVLRKTRRRGLHKLFNKVRLNQSKITGEDVVFSITPKINAASRMGIPIIAFKMLSTDSDVEADELVRHLDRINNERKGTVASMVKEIKRDADNHLTVITKGDIEWKPSLLGLAANTIMEEFNVPVFLWGRGEGKSLKGSCRVPIGMSGIDIMNRIPDNILESFGGHHQAGGFVAKVEGVDLIQKEFELAIKSLYPNGRNLKKEYVDLVISSKDVTRNLFNEINKCAPFGNLNEKPRILIKNCNLKEITQFGKSNMHLKLILDDSIEAISFFTSKDKWKLKDGAIVSVVGEIEESNFNGSSHIRIRILDII